MHDKALGCRWGQGAAGSGGGGSTAPSAVPRRSRWLGVVIRYTADPADWGLPGPYGPTRDAPAVLGVMVLALMAVCARNH